MKKAVVCLVFVLVVMTETFIYWFIQPPLEFPLKRVIALTQKQGTVMVIDVPLYGIPVDSAYIQNKVIDLDDHVIVQSPVEAYEKGAAYKILTDSRLRPGDYNVVLWVNYKLNPFVWKEAEFNLAVLTVKE